MPRLEGLFEVLEKICPNACKVDLPGDNATFNMADLGLYHNEDEGLPSLRINCNQPRGNGRDHPLEPLEDHQASI